MQGRDGCCETTQYSSRHLPAGFMQGKAVMADMLCALKSPPVCATEKLNALPLYRKEQDSERSQPSM